MKAKLTKLFTLLAVLLFGFGQMWATDVEIPLTNLKNFPLDYGLVTITNTENTTIGSNQLQSNKTTAKFKIATKVSGVYLKTVSFTDANVSKNGGFTCDEGSYMTGPTSNVYTYTAPNTTTTEANFQLIGKSGTAKMGTIIITVSTDDQVERLTAFGSISAQKIPFTSSAATSNIELSVPTSSAVSTSSSRISIGSGGKHLIVSTKNNKVLKYIAIPKYQQSTYEVSCSSDPTGTYSSDVWTPSSSDVKSVNLTLTVSSTVYSQEVYVIYEDGAPIPTHTLSSAVDPAGKGTVTLGTSTVEEGATTTATYSAIDAAYEFDEWQISGTDASIDDASANPVTVTMGTSDATITLKLKLATTKYAITKGTHANGDFTISPAEQEENGTVTLVATPNTDYMLSGWEVVKTSDASATGITVDANGQFTMPAYPVTVNATFVADTRDKVLYVTSNNEETTKASDKLYEALKDDYNVKIVGPTSSETVTNYALVVLHESVGGGSHGATAVAAAKGGAVPVLNTKSYFYNNANTSDRWGWGTPNAGTSVKGATQNGAYCNIASHPLFAGVTVTDGFFEITDEAAAKCMQPIGAFTTGKEGYTLATTPNNGEGNGCAIHELTPAQRGVASGKYLMISVSSAKLNALNANGQKLFQNAAAYLIGSSTWTPIVAPTLPEITATPSENYTEGNTITLTASATGTSASTTYTWYKGDDWATASATTPVQAASTSGATFTKTAVIEDAGTYWCNISNGTSCDVQASVTITVSSASTPTHSISYDNVKGADMSAYPTEYTEGVGVASFAPLADITGWHFVEWSPATIGTDATTDQTITAVWAQVFEVTFNLQGHGAAIAKQDIVDGAKAAKPDDPSEIGWDFGGWFTDAECTAGNEFDFNTAITATTPLFAKWTAFGGCAILVPATSGSAPAAVGDEIVMLSGSTGATMTALAKPENLTYTPNGLQFGTGSGTKANVVLANDMAVGTTISMKLVAAGTGTRGLFLYTSAGTKINAFTCWVDGTNPATNGAVETFTYTVTAGDGLEGTNEFQLWRNNTVILNTLKVESCGSAVIFHDLTSAVDPTGKGTVTLGASSVREGYTTTAEYSAIDPAYEFDEWQISGTDASIADASANPAVITMGTADAVVTLKLKVATVKHNVTFNTHGGSAVAPQEVEDGANPVVPTAPTREDYIFQGWAEVEDGAIVDVTSFAITADKEFHAIWVAEPAGIKLINGDGSINTVNFTTGVTASTVNFDDADHNCAAFGSTGGTIVGLTGLNKVVAYNATTTQTRVKFILYNTNSSEKELYLQKVLEGATEAVTETIAVPSKERHETIYYTYNSSDLRSFYVTVNSTNIKILQMKVIEDGTVLKRAGETGYELNLNQGRVFGAQNEATTFEGLAFTPSSNAKVLNSTELQIKTPLSFTIAAPLTLTVTTSSAKYYVSQNAAEDGTTATAVTAAGTEEFNLVTTGTWYIVPSTTSAVKLTNIAFSAPKCAEPAFNALDNSELCEGDPFEALDGTATVADAGVPTYQWYNADGDVEIDGATSATYTPSADGSYYVIATNHLAGYADNAKQSATVTVTHFASASITTAPVNVRETVGTDATLTVVAAGKNLGYAWYTCDDELGTNPVVIPGETAASLTITVTAGLNQYYKVLVSSDCGSASAVAKIEEWTELPQVNVSATTTWDWTNAATENIKLTDATTPAKNTECLMANINIGGKKPTNDATFNSQALLFYGENVRNIEGGRTYASVGHIKFTTTVSGMVEVEFSDNGSNNRRLNVNGNLSESSASKTDVKTFTAFVSAGDVTIMGVEEDGTGSNRYVRISKIIFTVKTAPDYIRSVTNNIGTLCVDHNVPAGGALGATFYQIAGKNDLGKLVFEEVTSLNAGEPYVFQSTTGGITLYYGEDVEASPVAVKGMIGSFTGEHVDIDDSNKTNIMYIANNKLWDCSDLVGSYLDVVANRAYIFNYAGIGAAPAHAPGKRYIVVGKDQATGFDQLEASEAPMKLIIDGQLFILRGEKMYNANGQLVK